MDQICLKRVFPVKNRKSEQHQWILNIHIRWDTKLLGKLKGTCRGQSNLLDSQGDHPSFPELGETLVPNVSLNENFFFFEPICLKKTFLVKLKKREHHHWILHIHVSLSTKFLLNWQFWLFWPNLPKKSLSSQNGKKWTAPMGSSYCTYWGISEWRQKNWTLPRNSGYSNYSSLTNFSINC